ncbi:MAG: ATP-binding protein [Bacilli bacterium]
MKAIRIILASIRRADKDFNLINNNDKICVGVSGGKDSMSLLYSLSLYKKFSKTKFEIYPCIIDLGFPNFDSTKLKEYCLSLGLDLYVADGKDVYKILKIQEERQKTPYLPCSICSKMKKAIINKAAHKLHCNKVSFAHHKDDAVETLFLNEIYGGRIATFSPKMFLTNEKITFIRPLIYSNENDLKRLVKEENIPVFSSNCPNDKMTKREDIKLILQNIYKNFPSSKDNFLTMMSNDEKEDIFYMHKENKIEGTDLFYKKINNYKDYIDEILYLKKSSFSKKDKNGKHLAIYNKNTIVGLFILENIKNSRDFIIKTYKVDSTKYLLDFLKTIINNIYDSYNPCKLFIKAKKKDVISLKEFGFNSNKEIGTSLLTYLISKKIEN